MTDFNEVKKGGKKGTKNKKEGSLILSENFVNSAI
jgi:hypothetical protein